MKAVGLVLLSLVVLAAGVMSSAHARTFSRVLDNASPPAVAESSPAEPLAVCAMPWAIIGDQSLGPPVDYWGLAPQQLFIGALGPSANFWPVALYGNGVLDYRQAIVTPCGSGDRGACDQEDPRVWVGETLHCDAKTGVIGQITNDALTLRYGAGSGCDATTHEQAVALAETEPCNDRAVFVPIIDAWPPAGQGGGPMHILDIATFYIAAWDRSPPYGDLDLNGDTLPDGAMVWGYFLGFQVAGRPIPVDIDIKPGSYPNSINLKSRGVIPVAVLSTEDFDASTVDPMTVVFAGASQVHHAVEDVDRDGDHDLILHFKTQETNLAPGDTEACLTGQTHDGMPIRGCDSLRTVPSTATPTPTPTPTATPPALIELEGTIEWNECGCTSLYTADSASYLLMGDLEGFTCGARVRVSGTLGPDIITTCMGGRLFFVEDIVGLPPW